MHPVVDFNITKQKQQHFHEKKRHTCTATLLQTNMPALSAAQHHFFPPPPCLEKECPRGHIRGRRED